MKTVYIHKGQGVGAEPMKNITIIIDTEIKKVDSNVKDYLKKYDEMFNDEAQKLFDALCETLPGGTLDMLLIKLLEKKKSYFIIPFLK